MDTFFAIYMGKPRNRVGKSNGWHHSVCEASENVGCDLRPRRFSPLLSLFRLISINFAKALFPTMSKFIVLRL